MVWRGNIVAWPVWTLLLVVVNTAGLVVSAAVGPSDATMYTWLVCRALAYFVNGLNINMTRAALMGAPSLVLTPLRFARRTHERVLWAVRIMDLLLSHVLVYQTIYYSMYEVDRREGTRSLTGLPPEPTDVLEVWTALYTTTLGITSGAGPFAVGFTIDGGAQIVVALHIMQTWVIAATVVLLLVLEREDAHAPGAVGPAPAPAETAAQRGDV